MKNLFSTRLLTGLTAAALLLGSAAPASAAPFTPGNLVVVRVGDGTAALGSAATATYLLEYTPAGVLVQTIALPPAAAGTNAAFTISGTSTAEGSLTRSADGRYLVLTGYDAAPGTASVAATAAGATNRVIARVAADGTITTSTRLSDAFSGAAGTNVSIRSAATADGTAFYAVGSTSGVVYVPFANAGPTTALSAGAPTNNRVVGIFGGNLYVSSASGTSQGLSQVGTGLPTTGSPTLTPLPGFPTATGPQPYAFYFADLSAAVPGVDVVYVADDRAAPSGGLQKWSLVGGTWTLNGTISNASGPALRGLSGSLSGTTVTLAAAGNGLFVLTDNAGYNAAPSTATLPAALAPAAPNTAFRGVAFAPAAAPATASRAAQALPGLSVYPNPAQSQLTVALPRPGAARVALRDLAGRLVLATTSLPPSGRLTLPAALPAGTYLLEVQQGAETAVRRVMKD